MGRLLVIFLVFLFVNYSCAGQTSLVQVITNKAIVYVGTNIELSFTVSVKENYHIQANNITNEALIPTTLSVDVLDSFFITRQEFPPGKQFKLEGTDTLLKVYDGEFIVTLFITLDPSLQAGNYILNATLHYQACNSKSCLFPRSINFPIPVTVITKE